MLVFSVWDVRAERYLTPFFMNTKGEAVRAFMNIAQDERSVIGMNPGDYKLVCMSEWNEKDGMFCNQEAVTLAWASDFSKVRALKGE